MKIPSFMEILPTWEVGATFVGVSMLLVMGLTVAVRRKPWFKGVTENAEFIGLMYPMIGTIFGVVLAFTIVLSWQSFAEAETRIGSEVTLLSSISRNSQAFPCETQKDIETQLLSYAKVVVACEWKSLASDGNPSTVANRAYASIWKTYREYVPESYTETQFYEAGLRQLNQLGLERRYRIMSAKAVISRVVWIFLCVGGIATIVIPMIFWTKHTRVQVGLNMIMTFIISFSLWIVAALQYPYSGDVSVSESPFTTLIEDLDRRRLSDDQCVVEARPVESFLCDEQ